MKRLMRSVLWAGVALVAGCVQLEPVSHDGLLLQDDVGFGAVYARDGVDLAGYDQFALAPCEVAFREHWLRDQNQRRPSLTGRVRPEDMQALRASIAGMCDRAFLKILEAPPAYTVVDSKQMAAGTLLLRPAIIDLDIAAPDLREPGILRTFTAESTEMTLNLEVMDGHTGEMLFRVIDRQRDLDSIALRWTTRVTNRADTQRILNHWAKHLRDGLDRVMRPTD